DRPGRSGRDGLARAALGSQQAPGDALEACVAHAARLEGAPGVDRVVAVGAALAGAAAQPFEDLVVVEPLVRRAVAVGREGQRVYARVSGQARLDHYWQLHAIVPVGDLVRVQVVNFVGATRGG